jgi:hypothetical protein
MKRRTSGSRSSRSSRLASLTRSRRKPDPWRVGKFDAPKAGVGKLDVPKAGVGKLDVPKAGVGKLDVPKSGVGKLGVGHAAQHRRNC